MQMMCYQVDHKTSTLIHGNKFKKILLIFFRKITVISESFVLTGICSINWGIDTATSLIKSNWLI